MKRRNQQKNRYIPFALPAIGREEIKAVVKSLKSGWLTTGPNTHKFEEKFAEFVGVKYAAALNSCTAALHLALLAVGVKKGDEVIVPTMTFTATAEVVTYLGAKPVFVDCLPDTLLIDPGKIEAKITRKTKAIIPVHYGGQACNIDAIIKIAKKHHLKIVWDAAHSFPTFYKGRNIAKFADVVCFSFYATKTITTGEGGMAVSNNPKYIEKIKVAALHGMSRDAWKRYQKGGSWYYEIIMPGFKYNLTDAAASLGLEQLKKANIFLRLRTAIARRYTRAFSGIKGLSPLAVSRQSTHAWHLYVIKLDTGKLLITRDKFIDKLQERGIGTSVHFIPLHFHPYWKRTYHLKQSDFPAASAAYRKIISLPIYPKMKISDVSRVIGEVTGLIKKYFKK
jgi:dTDP-4-amino-4,6-dideoxygalactose transaminase